MKEAYLKIRNLTKEFLSEYQEEKVIAVKDFNIEINKGEFVTLLGPSGCGKTTTLRLIGGFENPTRLAPAREVGNGIARNQGQEAPT